MDPLGFAEKTRVSVEGNGEGIVKYVETTPDGSSLYTVLKDDGGEVTTIREPDEFGIAMNIRPGKTTFSPPTR